MINEKIIQAVGQMFIVGFNGTSVPKDFKKLVEKYHLGGTILFKRNVESPSQIVSLTNDLQFNCRTHLMPPFFISIDHEGGPVTRLSAPFTQFPSIAGLGILGSPKASFEFGLGLGTELKAVGININYAPVVDVYSNPGSAVLRNRCFSSDAEVVAKMASAIVRGMDKAEILCVAKHFPGHGNTEQDSHLELPKLSRNVDELEKVEFVPFRRVIRSKVPGVMTAHILNTELDPTYPATLSHHTLTEVLRERLKFSHLIFSDDMEMGAISQHYSPEEAAVLAVQAGVDCLIYRGDTDFPVRAIEAILKAIEERKITFSQIELSNSRIQVAKRKFAHANAPLIESDALQCIGTKEHQELAKIIAKCFETSLEPLKQVG